MIPGTKIEGNKTSVQKEIPSQTLYGIANGVMSGDYSGITMEVQTEDEVAEGAIILDVSGSMSNEEFAQGAITILDNLRKSKMGQKVAIYQVDTEIVSEIELTVGDGEYFEYMEQLESGTLKRHGSGGTMLGSTFKKIIDETEADWILTVTDGGVGDLPEIKNHLDSFNGVTCWLITDQNVIESIENGNDQFEDLGYVYNAHDVIIVPEKEVNIAR